MAAKTLTSTQKLFGDAFSGEIQKKYRHKRDYTFFRQGKEVACLKCDYEISIEELREMAEELKADQCFITWTPFDNFCKKEVLL